MYTGIIERKPTAIRRNKEPGRGNAPEYGRAPATQEEMARKTEEMATVSAEAEGILLEINTTMATIEFMPDGTILTANENLLNVVKYNLSDIKGKHHKKFVPDDILNSDDYKTFWTKLASGIPNSGIFKRINSKGDIVWLNAIYNPISMPAMK